MVEMQDTYAFKQVEVVIGSDRVVRVNVDGICALRVKMPAGCEVVIDNRSGDELKSGW